MAPVCFTVLLSLSMKFSDILENIGLHIASCRSGFSLKLCYIRNMSAINTIFDTFSKEKSRAVILGGQAGQLVGLLLSTHNSRSFSFNKPQTL